jgi:hypothetical protein
MAMRDPSLAAAKADIRQQAIKGAEVQVSTIWHRSKMGVGTNVARTNYTQEVVVDRSGVMVTCSLQSQRSIAKILS